MNDESTLINVSNGFGLNTNQPYVQILIEKADFMTQMSPAEARDLAVNLLECAESAEQDAFLIFFLRSQGANNEAVAGFLDGFRNWREAFMTRQGDA